MNPKADGGVRARTIFAVVLAVIIGGLLVWIIQLARQGDPIGYIILTGLGVLASMPVMGVVLYMLIIDIGFNTLDVLVVEEGRISERISEGDTLGLRRAAERLIRTLKHKYDLELELRHASELIQTVINDQKSETYINGQLTDVTAEARRAVQALETDVYNFLDRAVGKTAGAYTILLTGGGALALSRMLLGRFPKAIVMYEPTLANARGLAKLAIRPGFLS